jgi:transcriptional regulator with XRE-family HTH domain
VPLSPEQAAYLKAFGASVKRQRDRQRLTQEKLAELAGLNPRTVQKIEAGSVNILVTTVARIRKALGCGWPELMGR